MRLISLLFLLVAGAALQSLFPAVAWLGYANVPVLCSVAIYFTLFRGGATMLVVAVLAGLFQDSLTLIPIGYSSFGFAVGCLVIERFRDVMILQSPLTHMVLTAGLHLFVTALLSILLVQGGLIAWQPWWLLLKLPGAVVLGLVTGPIVIGMIHALEEKLGLIEGSSGDEGAQRTYYGLG